LLSFITRTRWGRAVTGNSTLAITWYPRDSVNTTSPATYEKTVSMLLSAKKPIVTYCA